MNSDNIVVRKMIFVNNMKKKEEEDKDEVEESLTIKISKVSPHFSLSV